MPSTEFTYKLPVWFLKHHVKTQADLKEPRIRIVNDGSETETDATNEKSSETVVDGDSPANASTGNSEEEELDNKSPPSIDYDVYSEVRDIVTAALVPNTNGGLDPDHPSVCLNTKSKDCGEYMQAVVELLAGDIDASLISCELDDLEDIGAEFYRQDKERSMIETKTKDSSDAPVDDSAPVDNVSNEDTEAKNASVNNPAVDNAAADDSLVDDAVVVDAVGDGATVDNAAADDVVVEGPAADDPESDNISVSSKSSTTTTSSIEEPDKGTEYSFTKFYFVNPNPHGRYSSKQSRRRNENVFSALLDAVSSKTSLENQGPLLVYIRNADRIADLSKGFRYFSRIQNQVSKRREQGKQIVLLVWHADTSRQDGCSCSSCRSSSSRISKKILSDTSSTIMIDPTQDDTTEQSGQRIRMLNIRRLQHKLYPLFPGISSNDLLDANADWSGIDSIINRPYLGEALWSDEHLCKMCRQILGRGWRQPKLQLSSIGDVISRFSQRSEIKKEAKRAKKAKKAKDNEDNKADEWGSSKDPQDFSNISMNSEEKGILKFVIKPGTTKIGYDDVILDSGTKETIKQLVSMASFRPTGNSPKLLEEIRLSGALFYGPPGTGKTHLCRAIANDSKQNLIMVSAADVMSKWVGESEQNIKAVFTLARKIHPSIIFIDEADSLFYRRSSGDRSWERNFLTQILQEMDGLKSDTNAPLVIVATNRPMDLDQAFLRRLPHKVLFKLPNKDQRHKILQLFLHDDDLDPQVSIDALAERTEGFSGSDIRNLCGQAALAWATEQFETGKTGEDKDSAKVLLNVRHFAAALSRTSPTDSLDMMKELERWSTRFNKGAKVSDN